MNVFACLIYKALSSFSMPGYVMYVVFTSVCLLAFVLLQVPGKEVWCSL